MNLFRSSSIIPTLKSRKGSNFTTLEKTSEQERIEIIKTGFQLQAEGRISLKKYYEGVSEPKRTVYSNRKVETIQFPHQI